MTSGELIDLFVKILLRDIGGTRRRWRFVLGDVTLHSIETHHCNWSINPRGGAGENAAVERIADRLRVEHPTIAS
jgi:hypothetical protein